MRCLYGRRMIVNGVPTFTQCKICTQATNQSSSSITKLSIIKSKMYKKKKKKSNNNSKTRILGKEFFYQW